MKDMRLVNAAFWKREEERYASFKWHAGNAGSHMRTCSEPGCPRQCMGTLCEQHRPKPKQYPKTEASKAKAAQRQREKYARNKVSRLSGRDIFWP